MAADHCGDDVSELKYLLSQAKRQRVRSLLSDHIQSLEKAQLASPLDQNLKAAPVRTAAAAPEVRYTTLSSFSWEQDSEKVKIYVSLEGASEENLTADFQLWAFDIRLHDVVGKNYRCAIQKLHKAIVPDKSSISVKPKRIIITLKKADKDNWTDLYFKESMLKAKLDTDGNPMAGLMDMMKNMYEDGDDEMKKTIAQAWTEARSGRKPDPLKSMKY